MSVQVKICGLRGPETVSAAVKGGAFMLGFNFHATSPRFITADRAAGLAPLVPRSVKKVALVVDADDALIEALLQRFSADMLQLHGSETPERVRAVREKFRLPIIKALPVARAEDLQRTADYADVTEMFLFDAKAPLDELPGGNARSFDWKILFGAKIPKPWLLAGGLNAENLAEAVQTSGATMVDVASGVEIKRGMKDAGKITAFLEVAGRL